MAFPKKIKLDEDGNEVVKKPRLNPSPYKIIRTYCIECCGGEGWSEVDRCQVPTCPMFSVRFGVSAASARKKGKIVDPDKFVPEPLVQSLLQKQEEEYKEKKIAEKKEESSIDAPEVTPKRKYVKRGKGLK